MSNYTIKIPDIGEGITEVEIVEWFVRVGDVVAEDQNVASVMTEKVSVDITSPVEGTVVALGGEAGEVLAVGADLVEIALDNEAAQSDLQPEPQLSLQSDMQANVTPSESIAPKNVAVVPTLTAAPKAEVLCSTPHERLLQRTQASPAVRKRAANLSLDLNQLAVQLQKNHIGHEDLDRYLAASSTAHAPYTAAAVTAVPIRGVRRQIAKKMLESTQTIPHFTYTEAVDMTELEAWRQRLNQHWAEQRGRLTLLPFLVRAICLALKQHPEINARYNSQENILEHYTDVHIAIATQTDDGLKVPVLQYAQHLGFWEIAQQITELALSARANTGDLQAKSTITLSSLGALGGVVATPIINAPEVAIVGVNKQVRTPVVIDEQIQIRTMMNLSSSFDHRFVDGMHAAQFIQTVRTILETPHIYLVD